MDAVPSMIEKINHCSRQCNKKHENKQIETYMIHLSPKKAQVSCSCNQERASISDVQMVSAETQNGE